MSDDSGFRDRVNREHEALRQLLRELHEMLADRRAPTAQVADEMGSLATHLKSHFEEEEAGGFFIDVVARAPRFAEQVA
jgi:hemerythrin-like domain-containing protein